MSSGARGQASVELIAVLPLLVAGVLAVCQVALAGHAAWSAAGAARAAARASAVGADPLAAARRALPAHLDDRVRVRARRAGEVSVRLRIPTVLRALSVGTIRSDARFERQAS